MQPKYQADMRLPATAKDAQLMRELASARAMGQEEDYLAELGESPSDILDMMGQSSRLGQTDEQRQRDLMNPMTPRPPGTQTGPSFMDRLSDQPPTGPMPEPEPKSEHRRFAESKETSYDKVARQPGDRFEYAMKGDRIFVRDTTTDEEFRDVTGIQNEAAIKEVLEKYGSPQQKIEDRPPGFKRSGGGTMDMRELTGVEERPPVTKQDFEKAFEEKTSSSPEDVRLLQQLIRGSR